MSHNEDKTTFIQAFRQSSPYINAHRKKTFVIVLNSEALLSKLSNQLSNIIHDISLLNSLGVKIVLIYSSRALIDAELNKSGITSKFYAGKRITDYHTLDIIKTVSGKARFDIEAQFSNSLPNTPMHGTNIRVIGGNFITAKPLGVVDGNDLQFTGGVRRVDAEAIHGLLHNDAVVLLSNIAYSPTGECFNLSTEEIAVTTANAINADKLIIYNDLTDGCTFPRELMPKQAKSLLAKKHHHALKCMLDACSSGIPRCHMIDIKVDGSLLLELFTTDGIGTLLSTQAFEKIHTASISDVGGIMNLLEPLEASGILVKRERERLEQEIDHFIVIERDATVIACSALYPIDGKTAEIACVVTHPDYRGSKRGEQMLLHLEQQAKSHGLHTVFVLTTQSSHFFLEQGFAEVALEQLPTEKQQLYNYQRNSKVLMKHL